MVGMTVIGAVGVPDPCRWAHRYDGTVRKQLHHLQEGFVTLFLGAVGFYGAGVMTCVYQDAPIDPFLRHHLFDGLAAGAVLTTLWFILASPRHANSGVHATSSPIPLGARGANGHRPDGLRSPAPPLRVSRRLRQFAGRACVP